MTLAARRSIRARRHPLPAVPGRPPSLEDEIDLQDLVEGHGGMLDAVGGRLAIAAHGVEAIADGADRKSMARVRHRRQHLPAIEDGVIGFRRLECGEEALVLAFAAGHQDLVGLDAGADRAARRRHARARHPQVGGGSYISTRSTLLLVPEMKAEPTRPPMT